MKPALEKHWHHLPQEEVLDLLDTDIEVGLDRFAVDDRQQNYGPNALTERKGQGPLLRFFLQFNQAPGIYPAGRGADQTGTGKMGGCRCYLRGCTTQLHLYRKVRR